MLGILVLSSYKLSIKSISNFEIQGLKDNWLLWLFYIAATILTVATEKEELLLFLVLGFTYMVIKAPPELIKRPKTASLFLLTTAEFFTIELGTLGNID